MSWGGGAVLGGLGVVGRVLWMSHWMGGLGSTWGGPGRVQGMVRGEAGGWQGIQGGQKGPWGVQGGREGVRGPRGWGRADPVLCSQLSLMMLSMFLVRNLDSRYEKMLRGL